MNLFFNDCSLNGQFESTESFGDYLREVFLPMADIIADKDDIGLLSSYTTYSCMVTKDASLNDLLYRNVNDPTLTSFKSKIAMLLAKEPFWNDNPQTNCSLMYKYPAEGIQEPNCFTEAIAMRAPMLSVEKDKDCKDELVFECFEGNYSVPLINIQRKKGLLKNYLKETKDLIYVIENYDYEISVDAIRKNDKCYARDDIESCDLNVSDLLKIVDSFHWVIDVVKNNQSNHYSKYLGDNIYEYRLGISSQREFRWFYTFNKSIKMMNAFIKKTQKTPQEEIERAKTIMREAGW
ncbi:MAG: type II toxin-antitoxin system RelE/ParE family toxin [Oscillospiraceae bacterium]|nr:type II toxin-antitoxin system RelE/ParE family toxin [Oscillospiraceae bacterium]